MSLRARPLKWPPIFFTLSCALVSESWKRRLLFCVSTCTTQVLLRLMKSQQRRKRSQTKAVHAESHRYARGNPNRGCFPCAIMGRRGLSDIVLAHRFLYRWPIRSVAKMPMPAELSHCMLGIQILSVNVYVCDICPTRVH